jgi:hypothetical protein
MASKRGAKKKQPKQKKAPTITKRKKQQAYNKTTKRSKRKRKSRMRIVTLPPSLAPPMWKILIPPKRKVHIREGKSPDDKKNSAFFTKFFASFHFFRVLFPSSRQNSTKPQHFTTCQYSAKHYSGIMYYISP